MTICIEILQALEIHFFQMWPPVTSRCQKTEVGKKCIKIVDKSP